MLETIALGLAVVIAAMYVTPRRFRVAIDREAAIASDIDHIGAALETYHHDVGHYPSTAEGLRALVAPSQPRPDNWFGPYVSPAAPNDPWSEAYLYRRYDDGDVERYTLSPAPR